MQVTIAISTVDRNILSNSNLLELETSEKLQLLIVNQLINDSTPLVIEKPYCMVINDHGKGISRSRNLAINQVREGILVIADDDVSYKPGFADQLRIAYKDHPNASVITFKIETPDGYPFKQYRNSDFQHNRLSILKVSSIGISLLMDRVTKARVQFDERFGLGSIYNTGEENIFLSELIKKGHKAYFFNEALVVHPPESSGRLFNRSLFYDKGALFRKIFGGFGIFIVLYFCLRKYKLYNPSISSLITVCKDGFRGFREFNSVESIDEKEQS